MAKCVYCDYCYDATREPDGCPACQYENELEKEAERREYEAHLEEAFEREGKKE